MTEKNTRLFPLLTNVGYAVATQVLGKGVVIVTGMVVASFLGLGAFAAYSFLLLTAAFITTVASGGVSPTLGRYVAQAKVDKSELLRDEIRASGVVLCALAACVFVILLAAPQSLVAIPEEIAKMALPLLTIALLVNITVSAIAGGAERFSLLAKAAALQALLLVLFCVFSVIIESLDLLVGGLIASYVLASSYVALKLSDLPGRLKIRLVMPSASSFFRLSGFAGPVFLSSLLFSSALWIAGRTALSGETAEKDFAYLAIGLHWFSLLLLVPNMVSKVLAPAITRHAGFRASGTANPVMLNVTTSLVVAIAGLMALALLTAVIANLYRVEETKIRPVLLVLGISAVLASPINAMGTAMIAARRHHAWLALSIIWWASFLVTLYFAKSHGPTGIAVAFMISYAIHLPLTSLVARSTKLL
ncbi:MAG: hypothetical protein ACXIUZ_09270 [Lysobacteraceae bacterium]